MAFTQLDLNYATEYSKAMANAYPYLSYFLRPVRQPQQRHL